MTKCLFYWQQPCSPKPFITSLRGLVTSAPRLQLQSSGAPGPPVSTPREKEDQGGPRSTLGLPPGCQSLLYRASLGQRSLKSDRSHRPAGP